MQWKSYKIEKQLKCTHKHKRPGEIDIRDFHEDSCHASYWTITFKMQHFQFFTYAHQKSSFFEQIPMVVVSRTAFYWENVSWEPKLSSFTVFSPTSIKRIFRILWPAPELCRKLSELFQRPPKYNGVWWKKMSLIDTRKSWLTSTAKIKAYHKFIFYVRLW